MKIPAKYFYAFFFLLFYTVNSFAQNTDSSFSPLSVAVSMHDGFFIANQPKSQYLRDSRTVFGEIDVIAQTSGKKLWQQANNYPRLGLGILYGNTGSEQYLGKMAAIFPFIDFPLYRRSRFNLNFRLGLGAAWIEKPFDKNTNYKNFMIGTHLNAAIRMALLGEILLHKQLYLNGGFSFTHFSNGAVKLPNLGLNIPALTLGLRYAFSPPIKFAKKEMPEFKKKIDFYLFASMAFKQTYPLESKACMVNIVNFEIAKNFSFTGRYGGGVNLTYDRSLSSETAEATTYTFDKSKSQFQGSIYGYYEHVIGNLSIPLQVGVYVYNQYQVNPVYEDIGIRYRFSKHMIASLQLKTHLGKADYIHWGLGYKF